MISLTNETARYLLYRWCHTMKGAFYTFVFVFLFLLLFAPHLCIVLLSCATIGWVVLLICLLKNGLQ